MFDPDVLAANVAERNKSRTAQAAVASKRNGGKLKAGNRKKTGSVASRVDGKGTSAEQTMTKNVGGGDVGKDGKWRPEPKHSLEFNRASPNGTYFLQLADPYEHQVATELVYLWDKHGPASWLWATLNGASLSLTSAHRWPGRMPEEGTLEVAVFVSRLLEHRIAIEPVLDRVVQIFAAEVEHPAAPEWWRLQLVRALAQSLFFTCAQSHDLVRRLEASSGGGDGGGGGGGGRVEAVLSLFPRVVDPQHFHAKVLTPLLADSAVQEVLLYPKS